MRFPPSPRVEKARIDGPAGENYGRFLFKVGAFRLRCLVSVGQGWDHVSVSLENRCPTWAEMDYVKQLFWKDEEVVMQLHVNDGRKVNQHDYCLHLWRPQTPEEHAAENQRCLASDEKFPPEWFQAPTPAPIPLPPQDMV